jgi:hypothetical protein
MIKKYRNGKEIEQQAVFDSIEITMSGDKGRLIRMTPSWDITTTEFSPEYSLFNEALPEYREVGVRRADFLTSDDLLP